MSEPTKHEQPPEPTNGRYTRIGIILILLSGVFWFSLFAIPFLPLSVANKALVGGALFIGLQIAWWSGAALAGPRVVGKIKSVMHRKKVDDPS